MGTLTEATRKKTAAVPITAGVVFELEKLALPGHRLLFEACQKVLKDKQVVLTNVLWSRFCLALPLAEGLDRLLAAVDKKSSTGNKLSLEVQEQFLRAIARPTVKLNSTLDAFLTETARANIKAGALSFLPGERAQALLAHLGLQERLALHVVTKAASAGPTPDAWLMTCKAIGVLPCRCVALVSSALAHYAALKAGLRCIAIPDELTIHQDFGGADLVVEDLKDVHAKDLQALLHSCAFR